MKLIKFLEDLYNKVHENETAARGAQLSYYFILSVFPFLIFLLNLIDYTPLTRLDSLEQLSLLLPEAAFVVVSEIVSEVAAADNFTFFSIGILATIWIASRGTTALIKSINRAYNITENMSFFRLNAIGILATLNLALVILFTLIFLIFGKVLGELVLQYLGFGSFHYLLWELLRYAIPIIIIFVSFTMLFLYSPTFPLKMRHVYPGAIFSTVAWILASQAFAYYVTNFGNYSRIYGSIGGIIVFMLWFYISSVAVLLGGDINATLYSRYCNPKHNSPA